MTFMGKSSNHIKDPISKVKSDNFKRDLDDAISDSLMKEKYEERIMEMLVLDDRMRGLEKKISNMEPVLTKNGSSKLLLIV